MSSAPSATGLDVRASRPLFARAAFGAGRLLQRVRRSFAFVLAALWACLIWYLSSISAPAVGEWNAFGAVITNLAHAPEFGMLTLLVCLCLPRADGWVVTTTNVQRAVWCCVIAYAIVDEFHQAVTPHRDPSVCDVLTDATASALVLLAVRFAGGERAHPVKLARVFLWGLAACGVCALIATYVPRLRPDWEWL